jgi:hypothetical protein
VEFVPNFITWILLRIGSGPNGRSCLEGSTLAPCQVSIFFNIGMEKQHCASNWARPSATVPTESVSDRARAFRRRAARTAAIAIHHHAVGWPASCWFDAATSAPCAAHAAATPCITVVLSVRGRRRLSSSRDSRRTTPHHSTLATRLCSFATSPLSLLRRRTSRPTSYRAVELPPLRLRSPSPPSTAASGAPQAPSTLPVASPELGGALEPHQPSQQQPDDHLTGAPLRPIVIATGSPPRWASCHPSPQIKIPVDRSYSQTISPPTNDGRPAEIGRWAAGVRGGFSSPVSSAGPKPPEGAGPLSWAGRSPAVGWAQVHSALSQLPFDFLWFNSNQFWIWLNLVNFVSNLRNLSNYI